MKIVNGEGVRIVVSVYGTPLQMLKILRSNGRMKIAELSEELGASERQIRYYKQHLIDIGFDIVSHCGKVNGGYELIEVTLSAEEWEVLREALKEHREIYDKISYRLLNTI